jgi:hypothetical protein
VEHCWFSYGITLNSYAGLIFAIRALAYLCGSSLVQVFSNHKRIYYVCAGLVFSSKAITYLCKERIAGSVREYL